MQYSYSEYVPILKALSDETRLKIVDMLSCGTLCACDILEHVHISQSTLSYHMKILTECGLIDAVKDGSWMRYSLNKERSTLLTSFISDITNDTIGCVCKESQAFNEMDRQMKREC